MNALDPNSVSLYSNNASSCIARKKIGFKECFFAGQRKPMKVPSQAHDAAKWGGQTQTWNKAYSDKGVQSQRPLKKDGSGHYLTF